MKILLKFMKMLYTKDYKELIKADNVELNLMTKNMEIFMQNNNEKVEISSK